MSIASKARASSEVVGEAIKVCTKCNQKKPLKTYRHRTKFNRTLQETRTVIDNVCRDCQNARRRALYSKTSYVPRSKIVRKKHPRTLLKAKGWGWNPSKVKRPKMYLQLEDNSDE